MLHEDETAMPTPAEDEAERLKKAQEAAAAAKLNEANKGTKRHADAIDLTLRSGMAKDQIQPNAQPTRPETQTQAMRDYQARQDEQKRRDQINAQAAANVPAHPNVRMSQLQGADSVARVESETKAAAQRTKDDLAKQEAAKAEAQRLKEQAEKSAAEQIKRMREGQGLTARQPTQEKESEHLARRQAQSAIGAQPSPEQQRTKEQDARTRMQELRSLTHAAVQAGREQSDRMQRQANQDRKPAREETEKQQSRVNNGKSRDKGEQEM